MINDYVARGGRLFLWGEVVYFVWLRSFVFAGEVVYFPFRVRLFFWGVPEIRFKNKRGVQWKIRQLCVGK